MTLNNFLNTYGGNNCISIKGYCEEMGLNEIKNSDWYRGIKNKAVDHWQTIGGDMYDVEICIALKN